MADKQALYERLKKWQAFNEWERKHPDPPVSRDVLVDWYSEAWEFSWRHSPGWSEPEIDMEKIERIRQMREAFGRLGGSFRAP